MATINANNLAQSVSLIELLELAISSQDVGTVNFNILRLLLEDLVKKISKVDKDPVKLGDHDANQVANYKNYMQGAAVSPMPGILRYPTLEQGKGGGRDSKGGGIPTTLRSARPPGAGAGTSPSRGSHGEAVPPQPSPKNHSPRDPKPISVDQEQLKEIQNKIAHLEHQLNVFNELPNNAALLHKGKGDKEGGMSVNDMWQLIQLNNRIAAVEAAIQKMASLIEDLARELNKVRTDTSRVQALTGVQAPTASEAPRTFDLNNMTADEIASMTIDDLNKLTPDERRLIEKMKSELPPTKLRAADFKTMNPDDIANISISDLAKISPSQAMKIHPSVLKHMTTEQLAMLVKRKNAKQPTASELKNMTADEIALIPVDDLNKLLQTVSPDERRQIEETMKSGRPPTNLKAADFKTMNPDDIADISISDLAQISPSQAMKITPSVLEHMTPEQLAMLEKRKNAKQLPTASELKNMTADEIALIPIDHLNKLLQTVNPYERRQIEKMKSGRPPRKLRATDFKTMNPHEIAYIPISDLAQISPSQAMKIRPSVLEHMTPEQLAMLEKRKNAKRPTASELKNMTADEIALIPIDDLNKLTPDEIEKITPSVLELMTPNQRLRLEEIMNGKLFMPDLPNFEEMTPSEIAGISVDTLNKLTPSEIANISDDIKSFMTPEQLQKLQEMLSMIGGGRYGEEPGFFDGEIQTDVEEAGFGTGKKRKKPKPKGRGKRGVLADETGRQEDILAEEELEIPKPALGEHMEILTMESYLASLPREQLEGMAADAVQQELQKQYAALQGMQNQLTRDIQDKMEIIYQKLLREIITQQLTTSPYTVIDGEEKCLGPGICQGHGMPAGIAVCQYPDPNEKVKDEKPKMTDADCPSCAKDDVLKNLKRPGQGKPRTQKMFSLETERLDEDTKRISTDSQATKDVQPLLALDLERLRDDLRSADFGEFDEKDILQRMGTLWEAVKVLKVNEDSLSSKVTRHEALLKKLPTKDGISDKYKDISGDQVELQLKEQLMMSLVKPIIVKPEESDQKGDEIVDKDDIQTLFNNLANVIAECADQKERIDQLVDAVRIIESGMVTKQFLVDMVSDKADKGQINTKVSYDEFGNTVDELHTQLHNLMVEGYQRNENWKKVTADLAEELAEKLDKVELAPIRAFFKSRLKKLEDRVGSLSALLEEPDPAGTRKKLLRDYNCISCDRHVHISGATNASILPTIGPALATSSSPSHRALDVHRLRSQRTRFDAETRELAALEKQLQSQSSPGNANGKLEQPLSDRDMMQLVNRYVGSKPISSTGVPPPSLRLVQQPQQLSQAVVTVRSNTSAPVLNVQQSAHISKPASLRAIVMDSSPMEE